MRGGTRLPDDPPAAYARYPHAHAPAGERERNDHGGPAQARSIASDGSAEPAGCGPAPEVLRRAIGLLVAPGTVEGQVLRVWHTRFVLRPFRQVDVFTTAPYSGNPVAVVLDGTGLSTQEMQRFAHWTNLSETTFVLPPSASGAHYRVRIFTPVAELPFAGHPTLGTCHAWLAESGAPADADVVVQECGAGLIPVRRTSDGLAFAAPPLVRSGPVDESLVRHLAALLGIERGDIVDAEWADNGPGWVAVLLASADAVLALEPGVVDLAVGVAGPYPPGSPQAFEVRAFVPKEGGTVEDPVTGSLNASLAQWLLRTGRATAPYTASQGTVLGRAGRIQISRDDDGEIWVGGGTVTRIAGEVEL